MLSRIFEYEVDDKSSAITKVRVIGPCITLYFKEKDFDSIPNLYLDGFNRFTEQAKIHNAVHKNDKHKKQDHIHLIKQSFSLKITIDELCGFFNQLIQIQTATLERAALVSFFAVKPYISESEANRLMDSFENFVSLAETRNNSSSKINEF